jgi:hypothetical protein
MKQTILLLTMAGAMFAQGGFRGPGRYEIFSPLSKKVLDMDRNDRRTIIQFDSRRTDNQTWDVSDAGGGWYFIRNVMNGYALAVQDDRNSSPLVAEPFNNSERQQWRFESGQDTTAIIVNRNGKAIDIPYGSTNNGTKINSYNRNNEVNQRWQFQASSVGGGGGSWQDQDTRRPGRGGTSRYDTPAGGGTTAGSWQRDADGVYFDQNDRTYKMDGDGVCFYRNRNFQGEAVCSTLRNGRRRMTNANFDIGSVKFFGRAQAVQVFDREDFKGNAVEITGDEPNFTRAIRNALRSAPQSIRVY